MDDVRTVVARLVKGKYPDGALTDDNKVTIINTTVEHLASLPNMSQDLLDQANAFVIWLGGLSQDLRCYGIQLMLKYQGIMFAPDEKSQERMDTVMDKVAQAAPYKAHTADRITKYHWPKAFTNTFEERLETLADEVAAEDTDDVPTVDLILAGRERPYDLDTDNTQRLIKDCLDEIKAFLDKYQGKPNILFYEKLNNFYTWLLDMPVIELGIMGVRSSLVDYHLPTNDRTQLPAFEDAVRKFHPFIVS